MGQKFSQEEENIISFFAWSEGVSINDITQEMKEALYPNISQLPENSKRMLLRIGGVIRLTSELPEYNDDFWNKSEEEQKDLRIESANLFIVNLKLNDELKNLYLNLTSIMILSLYIKDELEASNQFNLIPEQIKLIIAKESDL